MPQSETYNIDCLEYLRQLPDKSFHLAVVDPPYGINATRMSMGSTKSHKSTAKKFHQGSGKFKNRILNTSNLDWDNAPPDAAYFEELFRVSENQIIWGYNYFNLPPSRGIVVWDKLQPWENFSQAEIAWTSFDRPAYKIAISSRGGANKEPKIHPTQKPVELYNKLFAKYAQPGQRVLDTHLGSGSSRIAAYHYGLDFVGIELNTEY